MVVHCWYYLISRLFLCRLCTSLLWLVVIPYFSPSWSHLLFFPLSSAPLVPSQPHSPLSHSTCNQLWVCMSLTLSLIVFHVLDYCVDRGCRLPALQLMWGSLMLTQLTSSLASHLLASSPLPSWGLPSWVCIIITWKSFNRSFPIPLQITHHLPRSQDILLEGQRCQLTLLDMHSPDLTKRLEEYVYHSTVVS